MNKLNFIETYKVSNEICDSLIRYYKKNKEYKVSSDNKKIKDSTDCYFYNQSQNKDIKEFFNVLGKCVTEYSHKYAMAENLRTYMSNHIQHYKPNGGYFALHYERGKVHPTRQLVYMLYLNTVNKGGTEFPYQNISTPATKGNLIIWPAEFTHPHRGIISSTQEKYIATGWFEIT
tara:strand:- start:301 stop:825 length:525 start_codon:yes stop_codon:yes gene_type:complete